jgi:hypothetical protein
MIMSGLGFPEVRERVRVRGGLFCGDWIHGDGGEGWLLMRGHNCPGYFRWAWCMGVGSHIASCCVRVASVEDLDLFG